MAVTVPPTLDFLVPLARHFRSKGWRVDGLASALSTNPGGCRAGDETLCQRWATSFDHLWDVPWSRNPLKLRNFLSAPKHVRALVEQQGYDLVHVHTPVAAFVTRLALRNMRKQSGPRVIYTAHGFHFYEGGPRLRGSIFRRLE